MIAIESFKRFRMLDVIVVIILAGLWLPLSLAINNVFSPQSSYILSLLIGTLLMSLTVHLVRKAGTAILFYAMAALFTYNVSDLGATGINKVMVLVTAGIIFELVYMTFKIEVKNTQTDIIAATAISASTIPITIGLILSYSITLDKITSIVNLVLLSFLVGLAGAVISFLVWYNLRTKKTVLKFEYMR